MALSFALTLTLTLTLEDPLDDLYDDQAEGSSLGSLDEDQAGVMLDQGVPVVDIRRPAEWEETGVLAGSHRITFFDEANQYDLASWLVALDAVVDRNQPFILVCRMGVRTEVVGRYLSGELGLPHVHHLQHGISAWIGHGLPVESV